MANKPEVLALIPARGGSKGLPRKNILPLGGVPLIGRVIEAARQGKVISRVVISTEDEEIAEIARHYGAEVPFDRPSELASDTASMLSVVRHALGWLKDCEQYQPDILVLLQANSPFVRSVDIDRAAQMLLETGSDVVYTVSEIEHPPFWGQKVDENSVPRFLMDESSIPGFDRRQDMPRAYRPTGAIAAMRVSYFWNCPDGEPRFHMPKQGQKSRVLILDAVTSLDIDSQIDYLLAQVVINHNLFRP